MAQSDTVKQPDMEVDERGYLGSPVGEKTKDGSREGVADNTDSSKPHHDDPGYLEYLSREVHPWNATHPDDPERKGYHGSTHEDCVDEERDALGIERPERENFSVATHPDNAAPRATAYTNTDGTDGTTTEGEPVTEDAA
jgi:hypothetical protein